MYTFQEIIVLLSNMIDINIHTLFFKSYKRITYLWTPHQAHRKAFLYVYKYVKYHTASYTYIPIYNRIVWCGIYSILIEYCMICEYVRDNIKVQSIIFWLMVLVGGGEIKFKRNNFRKFFLFSSWNWWCCHTSYKSSHVMD